MKNIPLFALVIALIFGVALDWPIALRLITILLAAAVLINISITFYNGKKS